MQMNAPKPSEPEENKHETKLHLRPLQTQNSENHYTLSTLRKESTMTQDELTLVLDALKFCHGGEPCGTSEAIAVVEKALANVATNDIPKKHVDEIQKQRHEQEPVATVDDNSQKWAGMDGAIAFHLIERHADGWNDIRKMMGEWLSANTPQQKQEPTKAMIDAAERINWSDSDVRGNIVNMWQAMCAAAPPSPQRKPLTDEQKREGFRQKEEECTFRGMTAWQIWVKACEWTEVSHGIKGDE